MKQCFIAERSPRGEFAPRHTMVQTAGASLSPALANNIAAGTLSARNDKEFALSARDLLESGSVRTLLEVRDARHMPTGYGDYTRAPGIFTLWM